MCKKHQVDQMCNGLN